MAPSAVGNGGKSYNLKNAIFHNLWRKKSWRPNHRINLLLFLNKSRNLIPCSLLVKETNLFELVTDTEMKSWLSRNMLPNINTCENGWSNFSANLWIVSFKLRELTQFAWPNPPIYFNFPSAVPRDDVIESTRFMMRPPVSFHHTMDDSISVRENQNLLNPVYSLH